MSIGPHAYVILSIRAARQNDLDTLWTFLAIAAYEPHIAKAKATPLVAAHLAGWRRSCDFGYIAENSGLAVGATWARQFALDEEPTSYVDDDTPEIYRRLRDHAGRASERLCLML